MLPPVPSTAPRRRAIFIAPFEELSEPALVAELAARAEARGWDGFFLWDHVDYSAPVKALADPWVTMAAIAMRTTRILTGPLVTPLPRRRPHQLARETVTLDRLLGGGRLVLGVGLGSERTGEFDPARFGEEGDMRERARLLDEGLERLLAYWGGEFEPRPLRPIPIWVGARWPPKPRPLRRALRYDGFFPVDIDEPEALAALELPGPPYDVVVVNQAGTDPRPWFDAGATWCLTGFGPQPTEAAVRAAIDAGP
jgi:alkanesulfonate monooxygenase SsuD/methylene tetrahydromethanopterin reductase-like flavin-dependent oxidoreductase (luciferase family)